MRKELGRKEEKRLRFRGVFERYGTKPGYRGGLKTTLLIKEIRLSETGQIIADHLWFNFTKRFQNITPLNAGDHISFDARVKKYRKGYWGHNEDRQIENPPSWDWKLNYPTNIEKTSHDLS